MNALWSKKWQVTDEYCSVIKHQKHLTVENTDQNKHPVRLRDFRNISTVID